MQHNTNTGTQKQKDTQKKNYLLREANNRSRGCPQSHAFANVSHSIGLLTLNKRFDCDQAHEEELDIRRSHCPKAQKKIGL